MAQTIEKVFWLNGELRTGDYRFRGQLMNNSLTLEGSIMPSGAMLPFYEGEYTVIPKVEDQELETANKSMSADVEVLAIPYFEVENPEGGYTVTIAPPEE